ncbi:hypothetical protein NLU13_4657 [Sarocladium strictum]|uniref:Enoyl reductase (ER) domain-containing protein n=1 Tax=Sarocladium strictum TaxID=5046 RepID=A0AA39L8W5_SARSR|nr:hypothetical protein NLU13_4657 [Sarocladium strictum]
MMAPQANWRDLENELSLLSGEAQTKVQPEAPVATGAVPGSQRALLLRDCKQPYDLITDHHIPELRAKDEVLVQTAAIGLNPIDWKAPDFGFGIPELPYISGRELAGTVVQVADSESRWRIGDRVIAIATDYRDLRKAAFQEYAVAPAFNLVRLPPNLSFEEGATIGVAFVAASLALGVCMGADFSTSLDGPNLFELFRKTSADAFPADIRDECLAAIEGHEKVQPGDWIAVWGGSSTSANLIVQLARLIGLRVILVVDGLKHGLRLSSHATIRPDLLVDSHDPERAVEIIKANTKGKLRFGIDTRGKETATYLLKALSTEDFKTSPPSPPATPPMSAKLRAHLIGLTGLPKSGIPDGSLLHNVPIKVFHELPEVGYALCSWLERLLEQGAISPPDIIDVQEGLESINSGLDRMRRGEISGGKLVVRT